MTTTAPLRFPNKGLETFLPRTSSQLSLASEYLYYSEMSSTNRNKLFESQASGEKFNSRDVLAAGDSKSLKLASLLEQSQTILQKGKVNRFSGLEVAPQSSKALLRAQAMEIEHNEAKNFHLDSKNNTGLTKQKTSTKFESESLKSKHTLIQPAVEQFLRQKQIKKKRNQQDFEAKNDFADQDQAAEEPTNALPQSPIRDSNNRFQDLALQIQLQNGRKNALYKCLSQCFDETLNGEQTAPTRSMKQVSSQENLLQNCKSAESSNVTTTTCESSIQPRDLSKTAANRSDLTEKLSVQVQQLTEKKPRRNINKSLSSGKAHLLELLNRKMHKNSGVVYDRRCAYPQKALQGIISTQAVQKRKTTFSLQEDELLIKYYQSYGNDWKLIANHLPGRTEFMIRKRLSFLEEKYPNISTSEQSGNNQQNNDFNFIGNEAEVHQEVSKSFLLEENPSSANNGQDFSNQFLMAEADFYNVECVAKNDAMEFDCFHLNEVGNQPMKANDCISLFDLKFDDNDMKLNDNQDAWKDLLDFNQEIKPLNYFSPLFKSANPTNSEEDLNAGAKQNDTMVAFSLDNNSNTITKDALADLNGIDRVHKLLNQIQSIEQLFKITREEINKLQNKFEEK